MPTKRPTSTTKPEIAASEEPAPFTPYYCLETVSRLIDVPKRTLYRWRLDGNFPQAKKTPGGRLLIRADHLQAWLDAFTDDNLPGR